MTTRADAALLLSSFRKVAESLGLTQQEQAVVLGVPASVLSGWTAVPDLEPGLLDRMAFLVGAFGLAGKAFPGEPGAAGWFRRPNTDPMFLGRSPLDLILQGEFEDLVRTYEYLQGCERVW